MDQSWIKAHRQILASEIFKNAELFKLWMFLLMSVEWKDGKKERRGSEQITLKRGQILTNTRRLAALNHMHRNTVARCLAYLEKTERIGTNSGPKGTLITVINYDAYQGYDDKEGQSLGHHGAKLCPNCGQTVSKLCPNSCATPYISLDNSGPKNIRTKELKNLSSKEEELNTISSPVSPKAKPRAKRVSVITYSEIDKALAQDWANLAVSISPTCNPDVSKYAEAIASVKRTVGVSDEQMRKTFEFIASDDFWRLNAYSPCGLLKKSARNGNRKIDNILSRMIPATRLTKEQEMFAWAERQVKQDRGGL
jgi:hypothetical protein